MNRTSAVRFFGFALGVALLLAAAWYAASTVDWAMVEDVPAWAVPVLAGLVVGNIVTSGLLFWVVTLSFDATPRVSLPRMTLLIAASALLNYLPGLAVVRAGFLGRAAYLKAKHDLPLKQSALILGIVLGLSGAVLGAVAWALLIPAEMGGGWFLAAAGCVTLMIGCVVAVPWVWRWGAPWRWVAVWAWVPIRLLDLGVASARLWVAFEVLGQPVSVREAVVLASASLLVKLTGLTPAGLGLSEWAVMAVATVIAPATAAQAAAAAVLDRAAEVVVISAAGGGSLAWLSRRG